MKVGFTLVLDKLKPTYKGLIMEEILRKPETWVNTPYLILDRDNSYQYNNGFIKFPNVTKIFLGDIVEVANLNTPFPEATMEYMNIDEMLKDGWRVVG